MLFKTFLNLKVVHGAPHITIVSRLDEIRASRTQILRYTIVEVKKFKTGKVIFIGFSFFTFYIKVSTVSGIRINESSVLIDYW